MLEKIIRLSIKNKLIVGLFILLLIVGGIYNATQLPIDAVPDITNNQVTIITSSPSYGAADIERIITAPIEQVTRNIPGIIEQRSFSRFGLSVVTIVFKDETDIYWARTQVNERLQQVASIIPPEIGRPELGPVTTGLGEIYQYVVKPAKGYENKYSLQELRSIQDWIIRKQLLGTEGVADVSSFGGKLKQFEIAINPEKLKSLQVSLQEVIDAVEQNNQNTGGAYIEKGPSVLYIRSEGLVKNQQEIEAIAIKQTSNGTAVKIKDVAEVKIGSAIRYGAVVYNNEKEVCGAVVMMLKGENSSKVIKKVKEKIAEIKKTLPEGVEVEAFLDRTKMVNNAISTVERNLIEGALIVVLILVLFLGNFRAGLLVASVIPLSMLFAIILMNFFGVSGNLMSLGALDFGLIVDGAVIIVEAILHRLHHNKQFSELTEVSKLQMDEEVRTSSGKMMNAAVFGQIIILIVYLPILSLEGIEGKMFKPMAQTVSFAILGAFLLSLTYIPMMSSLVLSRKIKKGNNLSERTIIAIERKFKKLLEKALLIPKRIVAGSISLFVISVVVMSHLGGEFIPELEEGDFAVDTRTLTGSSLTTTIQATQKTAEILKSKFPEVEKVVTKIGSGEIPTDPMPIEASDMMVILKDKSEWTSAKTFDELAEKMSKAVEDLPGVTTGFQYPVQMRFNELMTGARQDVVCKIFGDDLDSLSKYAEELGRIINTVDGARDLYVESTTGLPQLVIRVNRDGLIKHNLTVNEVNKAIATSYSGYLAGQIYEHEERYDIAIRLDSTSRTKTEDIGSLPIVKNNGIIIPLREVADVNIEVGPNQIQREDAHRRITIGFNVRGRDVESIVKELKEKTEKQVKFPSGYYITYGGQFENLIQARQRLMIAVPIALLLILLMLYFAFGKIKQGLLIFSAIPLSAMGGIFALWLRDMPFSISAGIGFIALFGVAVLNGIVLITEFNLLKREGMKDPKQLVIKGTSIRLRPVLMTACVASLGFLPMALSNGAGAEVQRPLATVVIGGLITATILTLIVLPILYVMFEQRKPKIRNLNFSKAGIIIIALMIGFNANAQQAKVVSKEEAVQLAIENNNSLKAYSLNSEIIKSETKSASKFDPLDISTSFGNLNGNTNDSRIAFIQNIPNIPEIIAINKQNNVKVLQNENERKLFEKELSKSVRNHYDELSALQYKATLLTQTDSLFAQAQDRFQRMFDAGEIGAGEFLQMKLRRNNLSNELQNNNNQIFEAESILRSLLQVDYYIKPTMLTSLTIEKIDTANISRTEQLSIKQLALESEVLNKAIQIEKAKFFPKIRAGYSLQSFNREGSSSPYLSNINYQSFDAGIQIPLICFNYGSGIKKSKAKLQINELNKTRSTIIIDNDINIALAKYRNNTLILERSLSTDLLLVGQLENGLKKKLNEGEINYTEWVLTGELILRTYLTTIDNWTNQRESLNEILFYSNN